MDLSAPIWCIVYAAKSTEDKRGSIPDQLRECREAIDRDPVRRWGGEYVDETFSTYTGDRGPGLAEAMRHVEDLAEDHGTAELWAQHSDRLARGDGRSARHAVEIALWALKRSVAVRTLQDPDTRPCTETVRRQFGSIEQAVKLCQASLAFEPPANSIIP